ncbi:hypothetical protein F5876DRAFT_23937, partial [Lentinula aff. lateritia]
FDPQHDLTELRGKVIIVTGGNRGTGLATVKHLARAGYTVYMAARNEGKALQAIAKLSYEGLQTGNGKVKWLKLDLSDPREAKIATKRLWRRKTGRTRKRRRLEILLRFEHPLNSMTFHVAGLSTMVVVNYSSPFVFTRTLIPLLTSKSTLMIYALRYHLSSYIDIPSQTTSKTVCPAHSKLLDILWPRSLQKHFNAASPSVPIVAMSIHPG